MTTPTAKQIDRFKLLTARKDRLWQRLQLCYDMMSTLPDDISNFKIRVSQLETTREEFAMIMDEMVLLQTYPEFATNVSDLLKSFDDIYYIILATSEKHLTNLPPTVPTRAPSVSTVSLPTIQLTKFNGSYDSFPAFIALYDNLIHNSDLPNIKKFSYLLGYVENSALQLLKTVTFAPENYLIAYQLLVSRYTNKRLSANHYLNAIFNLTPLKSDSHSALIELIDTLQSNVESLKSLQIPNLSDYLFMELALRLLDVKTRKGFESRHLTDDFPTFDDVVKYLRDQCTIFDLAATTSSTTSASSKSNTYKHQDRKRVTMLAQQETRPNCPLCRSPHTLKACPNFLAADYPARHEIVKKLQRCYACLGLHNAANCRSKYACTHCGSKRHNSLLHVEKSSEPEVPVEPKIIASVSCPEAHPRSAITQTLLGTAQAQILSASGQWHQCRILFDQGSQVNFVTASLVKSLGLTRRKCPYELRGVGQTSLGNSQGLVDCCISKLNSFKPIASFPAIVLPRITSDLPVLPLSQEIRDRFASLQLADPQFHLTAPIDILLGVDTVLELLPETPSHIRGYPTAVLTQLGWVMMGSIPQAPPHSVVSMVAHIASPLTLNDTLRMFWETEEIPQAPTCSLEDELCEKFFSTTTSRDETGRYVVRLPFRNNVPPTLGSTRAISIKRFLSLEARFKQNPEFYTLYAANIQDYISQGQLVPSSHSAQYILTHHGVTKLSSKGNQVRVVFNPAERDSKGVSLNDMLLSGPKLQTDIAEIITRFRLPQIALICDIKQMFRAISLHPDDRKYHHIFWRFSPTDPLHEWEHTRVIFGATSSPFLAQRTIQQLVKDEGSKFPLACSALTSWIYVDDVLSGADTPSEVLELRNQLVELLRLAGFELGKWACSMDQLISGDSEPQVEFGSDASLIKVLGLRWNPIRDSFGYTIRVDNEVSSKRGILSRIARIYDMNGYLCPFIFTLKALMQRLWLVKVGWDDALPSEVADRWTRITQELPLLEQVSIPRCILTLGWVNARLVGFSDASELGMAAVVYLRLEGEATARMHLVSAKSRVAPLKIWTIPRLELGAACLLSKLMLAVRPSFATVSLDTPVCFSDSLTTLAWIRTPPYRLKTFVANRVVQIQENIPDALWGHVPGKDNPADSASRGLLPSELLHHPLWWTGPEFVYKLDSDWLPDASVVDVNSLPETRKVAVSANVSAIDQASFMDLFERVSCLLKLQRIISHMKRFIFNCLVKSQGKSLDQLKQGPLTAHEYNSALEIIILLTQQEHLSADIQLLSRGQLSSKRYRLLSPFLSPQGFVMVGGRIKHAPVPERSRHPYLIPPKSRLATLLVDHYHIFSGHGGPQLIQSLLHRQFWIPSARDLIRKRIFQCLTCYRHRVPTLQPPMADLPSYRIQPSRCFTHTGLDFAGPFILKASTLRTTRTIKCYLALFICMVTKALHLEAVTSLTTDGCLAALDRVIARRGLPAHLYTDQGRNFKGAAREISEIFHHFDKSNEGISHYLASRNIQWHFNPPYAPNFGGLWESGVKSVKHHLKRIVGTQVLTFEEFNTILTRIEGILNSRPLCPLSSSPTDNTDYLTPGHFLTGGAILARPEPSLEDVPRNHLSRWQLVSQLVQSFWSRWSKEYIHTQICRPKWVAPTRQLEVGELVFWYSPGILPTQWPRGRVSKLLPGPDGVSRVVQIKTPTGDVLRPVNKVVPLPLLE